MSRFINLQKMLNLFSSLLPLFREYLAQKVSQVMLETQERKADKVPEVSLEYQEMMDHQ